MPRLSDIPGKGLVTGTRRRTGKVAAGAGLAVIAIGGYVVRRLLRRGGSEGEVGNGGAGAANADPIAETPTAPPGAEVAGGPEPSAEKPPRAEPAKPPQPEPVKPPQPEPAPIEPADAPDAPSPTTEQPPLTTEQAPSTTEQPPATTGTDAPPKPPAEPGDRSKDDDPHHALNNPVGDPDPTEWPDPYERRDDPRDSGDPDAHAPTNAESTSEPHPGDDPEAGDRAEPPKRDKLDD